ncbi:hypothetical protein C2I27_03515 [Priestia megaterium]|uniref:hypothetical protein n=1 Tax=Priestia megaterium TaxID=1404 RepID=UPI000D51C17A|nr:hypothetical protein [Priestia megaterium]PVC74967.1 hypothetical protein C2I27_03515 [Priestia megaterium]
MGERNIEAKIIRHDSGLDSKRIEKIIETIDDRISDIKYDRRDILSDRKKELKQEVIKAHNLQQHYDAIDKIDGEISVLKEQISTLQQEQIPHKKAIAKVLRGSDDTYNYSSVSDDSPADKYIKQHLPDIKGIKESLSKLSEEIEEKLWLAKDIDEARALHSYALEQIKTISAGITKEEN